MPHPHPIERARPITSTERQRQYNALHALPAEELHAQELHTTSDQQRIFRHHIHVGGTVDHGTIATAAAMAALGGTETVGGTAPRGVWVGDTCFRSDEGVEYQCISGSDSTAVWRAVLDMSTLLTGSAMTEALGLKQDAISNATTLAKITEAAGAPLWDGSEWPGGGGGGGWTVSASLPPSAQVALEWTSDGDANGLFYALGSLYGSEPWQNPVTRGTLATLLSGTGSATAESLANRAQSGNNYWGGDTKWAAWDQGSGSALSVAGYSLQAGQNNDYLPRDWVIEGTNSVSDWTIASVAAATWTVIDTRTADTTLAYMGWGHFTANGDTATAYRYLRMKWTTSTDYAILSEAEFYGASTFQRPATLPPTATGWMTDGAGHYIPYWQS